MAGAQAVCGADDDAGHDFMSLKRVGVGSLPARPFGSWKQTDTWTSLPPKTPATASRDSAQRRGAPSSAPRGESFKHRQGASADHGGEVRGSGRKPPGVRLVGRMAQKLRRPRGA
eukprot:3606710-Rhodomonas_salina.1